jgi:protein-S-isoprenylcysteine O-methyltransferase Ste14
MITVDEIWVFILIVLLVVANPFLLRAIHSDYKTEAELSKKSVVFVYTFFGLFIMTILNAALYTRWVFAPKNPLYSALGIVFLSVAIILIIGAFIQFRSIKRVSGLQADKVISTGVYRLSRNPQYLAIFLFLAGFSLIHRSIIAFALIPIFILLVNTFIVPGEEKYLEKSLGSDFLEYKKRVRRWA